ncbi:MAG: AEC family transporter [Kiritimatiellae bacterium]|nr:AEC family transporter [Kiritimatiellia bacterium]
MSSLLSVATQVGSLFVLMAVGFACRKAKLFGDEAVKGMVDILVVIVTPALVLHVFQRPYEPSMLRGLVFVAAFALAGHLAAIILSTVLFRRGADPQSSVLRVASVFSNAGFMGIPLEQAILGETGVFYGVVYVGVFNVVMWSWGYCTMRQIPLGGLKGRAMLVNPGTVGLALGLPVFFASFTLPPVLHGPVGFLAGLNTPLAMIVIGYHLAGAKLGRVAASADAWLAAAFRLLAYPLMMTGALALCAAPLAMDRTMMLALVVSASAPVAALTSMLAAKYGGDVDLSVGLVSGTTLLSIITMPPVIALAMAVLG